jgi:hypothetical protein
MDTAVLFRGTGGTPSARATSFYSARRRIVNGCVRQDSGAFEEAEAKKRRE